jgi:predicted ATP-grasp superfamily ATP-dependent carboligase
VDTDFREQCRTLCATVGVHGVALVQFIRDLDSGGSHLLEINPRMGASSVFAADCGFNLPMLAVKIARGEHIEPDELPETYPTGKTCIWTHGEIKGIRRDLREGRITRSQAVGRVMVALRSALTADRHVTWSWRDPGPALAILALAVRRRLRRLLELAAA